MNNFNIEQVRYGYVVTMYNKSNVKHSLAGNIAEYLKVTIKEFSKAVELYNGFYMMQRFGNNYVCFKSKEDANKFITDYLEPLQVINSIDK